MKVVVEMVRGGLTSEPSINHCTIEVDYSEGELILTGNVSSFYQKQMAQEAVKKVINGKKLPYLALSVRNELNVG